MSLLGANSRSGRNSPRWVTAGSLARSDRVQPGGSLKKVFHSSLDSNMGKWPHTCVIVRSALGVIRKSSGTKLRLRRCTLLSVGGAQYLSEVELEVAICSTLASR